jgi:hypothetical protein
MSFLIETRLGSRIIFHNTDLLYEEVPEVYKGMEFRRVS